MDTPEITPAKLTDEKRRAIIRGGLAAPVVLGTLASKQALGGGAQYGCSVSGKWSGGSTHGSPPDCHVGDSCEKVKTSCRRDSYDSCGERVGIKGYCNTKDVVWRDHYNTGSNTSSTYCGKTMSQAGFQNHGCYRKKDYSGNWVKCAPSTTAVQMTCYETLCQDGSDDRTVLCREAVCALYNATKYAGTYPCTPTQVVAMVNSCLSTGGVYLQDAGFNVANSDAHWTTQQCIAFFQGSRNSG